jgi:CubicO group peptidase (beta-lactamase class C family)
MDALADPVERIAADTWFSGVVRVDWDGEVRLAKAYGLAHRGWGVANTVTTRFAIASVTKGPTALTVVGLIEDGRLAPDTTARTKRSFPWSFDHSAPRSTGPP